MKRCMIAKAGEKDFQGLAFHDQLVSHIVDDQMGKIGLAGDRAKTGKFRAGEADQVISADFRVGDNFQYRVFRRRRDFV